MGGSESRVILGLAVLGLASSQKWERVAPGDKVIIPRAGHFATVNSTLYTSMGGSDDSGAYVPSFHFDLATDTILGQGTNPNSTWELNRGTSAAAPDGTIYSYSGLTTGNVVQTGFRKWDPSTNTWTTMNRNPVYTQADPPVRRFGAASWLSNCWLNPTTQVIEACFAMFGGLSIPSGAPVPAQVWIAYDLFNPNGFGWRVLTISGSPTARWNVATAASPDGSIFYMIGGDTTAGPTNQVWALATQGFPTPSTGEWTNIARRAGTTALASSFNTAPGSTVFRANDGSRNGNINANSCFRNNITLPSTRTNPWWAIDTNAIQQIDQVTICQPTMCCRGDMSGYEVWVSPSNLTFPWSGSPPPGSVKILTPAPDISGQCVNLRTNVVGRYVWIRLPGVLRTLTLCEVEVYQRNPMVFRQLSGTYSAGVGKPAFQTSRDSNQESTQFGGDPERAFDGITSGTAPDWAKTSNTAAGNDVFVGVDLLRQHDISTITLWPRKDSPDQRRNSRMEVYVSNSRDFRGGSRVWGPSDALCGACNLSSTVACTNAPPNNVPIPLTGVRGRYVFLRRVDIVDPTTFNVIQIGEIQITANRLLNAPTPRSGLAAASWGGYLVMFGGTTAAGVRLNDVIMFDLINAAWMPPVKVLGTPPSARMWATLTALPGAGIGAGWGVPSNRLLLFGGQGQTEALGDVSILRYPQCPSLSDPSATDISCSQAGTICYVSCNPGWATSANGNTPIRCRPDGTWSGVFPLCSVSLPSPPVIRSTVAGSTPGSAVVSWSRPTSTGYSTLLTSYRIAVYDTAYVQQFSAAGFTDPGAWSFRPGLIPQSGLYGFVDRSLYIDSCPSCDCNTRNQQCSILTRDFPTAFISPAGSFAIETYVEFMTTTRVALDSQAFGICLYDSQDTLASVTNPGICEVFVSLRRGGTGYAGQYNVGFEHNSGTFIRYQTSRFPYAFLRLERDFPNKRVRAGYKFASGDAWSYTQYRPDSVFSRGVNGTDVDPLPPAALKIGIIAKNWNTLLRSYAQFSYIRVGPLDCTDPSAMVEVAAPSGASNSDNAFVMTTTLENLDQGKNLRFTVAAATSAGYGPIAISPSASSVTTLVAPEAPFNASLFVEVAMGKTVRSSSICTSCNPTPVATRAVDNNPLTSFISSQGAVGGEWFQIDLGIVTAVKQIFLQNRADCCQARLNGIDVFVGYSPLFSDSPRCVDTPANITASVVNATVPGPTALFNCTLTGRYVTVRAPVQLDTTIGTDGFLNIAEMRVFASNSCPARNSTNAVQVPGTTCSAGARYGAVCTYACASGFVAVAGATTAICDGDKWSDDDLFCAPECPPLTLPAFAEPVATQTLAFENFDTPLSGSISEWKASIVARFQSMEPNAQGWDEKWFAVNNLLQGNAGLGCNDGLFMDIAAAKVTNWRGDFTLGAKVRTADRAGVFFGALDDKNMYVVYIDTVMDIIAFDRVVAGRAFRITDAVILPNMLSADTFYRVEVSEVGGVFNISLDGTVYATTVDTTFTAGIAGVYVQTFGEIDDVSYSVPVGSCQGANNGETCQMECPLGLLAVGPNLRTCTVINGTLQWFPDAITAPLTCTLQPPVFPSASLSIAENSIKGSNVGNPLVATLETPDYSVSWKIDQTFPASADGLFSIDACSGQVKVRRAELNFEVLSFYTLLVRAFVPEFASTAFATRNITITILDVDESPVLGDSGWLIAENSVAGTIVGGIPAWDPDNNTLSFLLDVDPTGGLFSVNPTTGSVTVSAAVGASALNFEGFPNTWDLVVRATQVSDPSFRVSAKFTITLTDVNDAPVLTLPALYLPIEYNVQPASIVATLAASDEDRASFASGFTYTLLSPSAGAVQAGCMIATPARIPSTDGTTGALPLFSINSATGEVTFLRFPSTVSTGWSDVEPTFLAFNNLLRAQYELCIKLDDTFSGTSYAVATVGVVADKPATPIVATLNPSSNLVTSGGQIITVTGSGFGNPGQYAASMRVWYGSGSIRYNVSSSNVTVVSPTQLTFITLPGVGGNLEVHVDIAATSGVDFSGTGISYVSPVVLIVSGSTGIPTNVGGRIITFTGSGFGPLGTSLTITYGPNAAGASYACTHLPSLVDTDTIATCSPAEGAGSDMAWTITVGNQAVSSSVSASSSDLVSYLAPTITSVVNASAAVSIYSLSTYGNEDIVIFGSNFGPAGTSMSASYGSSSGTLLNLVSCLHAGGASAHGEIRCKTVAGAGKNHAVSVTIAKVASVALWTGPNSGLAYKSPVITSLVTSPVTVSGNTEGGLKFQVQGLNFGPSNWVDLPTLTYGPAGAEARFSAVNCRIAADQIAIECETAPGCGASMGMIASVSSQSSPVYNDKMISYGAPQVFTLAGYGSFDADTRGAETIVLSGRNFGPLFQGIGYSCPLQVSYVTSLLNGPNALSTVDLTASSCAVTVDHVELTCRTSAGAGQSFSWTVFVDGQRSVQPTSNYNQPIINQIRYPGSPSQITDADVNGNQTVEIVGDYFGPAVYGSSGASLLQKVSYGPTGVEYEVPASSWNLIDDSRLQVRLLPGSGDNLFFSIMVADQPSISNPGATFSYAPISIQEMIPAKAHTFSDPRAPTVITLKTLNVPLRDKRSRIGLVFGNPPYAIPITAVIPQGDISIASATNTDGTVNISFTLPQDGGGTKMAVQLQVTPLGATSPASASAVTVNSLFNYLDPVVDDVVMTRARFSVAGENTTGTAINADAPACPFPANDAIWRCDDVNLNSLEIRGADFTMDPAKMDRQDGITRMMDFLSFNDTFLGEIWTTNTLWIHSWSHSRIVLFTPRPEGTLRLTLSAKTYDGSMGVQQILFNFKTRSPEISSVVGGVDDIPTTGGLSPIDIEVLNLQGATNLEVTVGGRPCNGIYQVDGTPITSVSAFVLANPSPWTIRVFPPEGQGSAQSVVILRTIAGKVDGSNTGFGINYRAPSVTTVAAFVSGVSIMSLTGSDLDILRLAVPTDGSATIRVTGTDLGIAPILSVGDGYRLPMTACASTVGTHTCYEVASPRGEGTGLQFGSNSEFGSFGYRLVLGAGNQDSRAVRFGYAAPIVTSVLGENGISLFPTKGGARISLIGSNFGELRAGRQDTLISVAFGRPNDGGAFVICDAPERVSHYMLNCTLPEGAGLNVAARVSIALVSSDSLNVLSYSAPNVTSVTMSNGKSWTYGSTNTLGGLAAGNDTMVILGSNFGKQDNLNCLFFAWRYRVKTDALRVPTCNEREDFLGEGEVSATRITSWDHESITLSVPRGIGFKEIEMSIRGNLLSSGNVYPTFTYDVPNITAMSPALADTEGGDIIVLSGYNFGIAARNTSNPTFRLGGEIFNDPNKVVTLDEAAALPTANVVIVFHRSCISGGRTLTGSVADTPFIPWYQATTIATTTCQQTILSHSDSEITFSSAPGIGKNRNIYVVVVDAASPSAVQVSTPFPFSFKAPEVSYFDPSTVYIDMANSKPNVDVRGSYFGDDSKADEQAWTTYEREVKIQVGGVSCEESKARREGALTILGCKIDVENTAVGIRNVSVQVVGQIGRVEIDDPNPKMAKLNLVCGYGFYGRIGETCRACPAQGIDLARTGAICPGYNPSALTVAERYRYPTPLKGWYNLNSSDMYTVAEGATDGMMGACPEGFQDGGRDVCIVPCDPPEACMGDNHCAYGYASKSPMWRCGSCDKGFYKRAGECIKCPDSPAGLFIGFIILVLIICAGAFQLNKKQINIAVMSIGVDFFQVLAIFSQSRIKWPPVVKELFHILSAFNLNIEIVAPECLIPNVSYIQKFYFIMLLPLCVGGIFAVNYALTLAYKIVFLGQEKKRWHSHSPALISSCLILVYMLYLYLTRTIFDVFNCAPVSPPDGYTYLQVVFERCGVVGGTQLTLFPFAIAAVAVYTAGYPAFIGYTLWKNREIVMEDQLLRAKGSGNDVLSGPRTYKFRLTYGRSFFQFKPDFCLWILAIILRKFFIALTAVVFNRNASFQMAACLLVVFVAYAAQVHARPYMSPATFDEVLRNHTEASLTSAIHARLRANLANIETRGRKKVRKNLLNFEGKVDRSAVFGILSGWLFNYNTVEEIMLFAAVIVCLMGIMYQATEVSTYYPESKDSVTGVVLAVIILAIIYFITVLVTEIVVMYNEDNRMKQLAKGATRGRASSKSDGTKGSSSSGDITTTKGKLVGDDGDINTGKLDTQMNPLFMNKDGNGGISSAAAADSMSDTILSLRTSPPQELWLLFQQGYVEMQGQLRAAQSELSVAKRRSQMGEDVEGGSDSGSGAAAGAEEERPAVPRKGKAQFAPRGADAGSNSGISGSNPLRSGMSSFSSIRKNAAVKQ